jgi:hypothetical protein
MRKQMTTVLMSLWKMLFRTARQNEEEVRVVAKSAAQPGTRNSDLVELGRDQNRMIAHPQIISNLGREEEVDSVAEDVGADVGVEVAAAAEEVEEANGLEKTNGCLRAVELNITLAATRDNMSFVEYYPPPSNRSLIFIRDKFLVSPVSAFRRMPGACSPPREKIKIKPAV